jgi:hypothetical protein
MFVDWLVHLLINDALSTTHPHKQICPGERPYGRERQKAELGSPGAGGMVQVSNERCCGLIDPWHVANLNTHQPHTKQNQRPHAPRGDGRSSASHEAPSRDAGQALAAVCDGRDAGKVVVD